MIYLTLYALKTTNSYFDLYRIVILPKPISSNTFDILLIIRILQFNTVSAITYCLRRLIIIVATEAVLPFAHLTFQYLVPKLKRAR